MLFTEHAEHPLTYRLPGNGKGFPLLIEVGWEKDICRFISSHRREITARLSHKGALLLRGWDIGSAASFNQAVLSFTGETLAYHQRTSPRTEVGDKVYTSTDYPKNQVIHLHNESSYATEWPLYIAFFCLVPPQQGGETPIADVRQVINKLSLSTVARFREKGLLYVRNMVDWLGLPWQEVYQTNDRQAVEALLRRQHVGYEWKGPDHLRISWKRPAFQVHPVLGKEVWFNHCYFYHPVNQNPQLLQLVDREDLPFSVYYGDGSEIEADVFEELQTAYGQSTSTLPWQKDDILLMDNMLIAHARQPYEGERKILVSMANPVAVAR